MKKVIISITIALSLVAASAPVYAAANHPIIVDGVAIKSDVQPEMKYGRTMVPLRVISENLGAAVNYSGSEVTITKDDMKVTLKLNSSTAVRDGKTLQLDAKPYIQKNRVLVPLRFLAETFDCTVNYSKGTVTVETAPLIINGAKAATLQYEYHMIIGGSKKQLNAKSYNEEIYKLFESNKGAKVDTPAKYGWYSDLDTQNWYTKTGQFDFLDEAGKSVQRFDPYILESSLADKTDNPKVLVFDVTKGQWYNFNDTALDSITKLMNTADQKGLMKSTEI